MTITAIIDPDQRDKSDRSRLAICPVCGQKLTEVVSLRNKCLTRHKCRRCKKYILVSAVSYDE